jgi:catechol 2,3-dioxygenase-like lactoylglutathione lyase family enzyme
MIKLTHGSIYVHDQDQALKFYRDILGMEVRADFSNGDYRWLTVGSKSQPDLEIVLMAATENHALSAESAKALQTLLKSGQMSGGVLQTDDAMRDYQDWSQKGVEFIAKPTEQYGKISGILKDPSGNVFNLQQTS